MNEIEKLVIEKAFPKDIRKLVYLLSTERFALQKSLKFYNQKLLNASKEKDKLPLNLKQVLDILQKPIIIPTKGNRKFSKTEVFFALSEKIRHNMLLFLQSNTESNMQFNIGWSDFLSKNIDKLDRWSKIILNQEISNGKETSTIETISKSSVQRLRKLTTNGSNGVQFFFDNTEDNVTTPPAKRRRLDSFQEDFFISDIDEEALISVCEKTEIELNISTAKNTEIKLSTIEHLNGEKIIKDMTEKDHQSILECSRSDDASKSKFILENEDRIENVKVKLKSTEIFSKYSTQVLSLFIDCSTTDIRFVCEKILIVECSEELFRTLYFYILEEDSLSFEKLKIILYHGITIHITELKAPISRTLFTLIVDVISKSRRVVLAAILSEVLAFDNFTNCHEDFLKKIISNGAVTKNDISYFLDYAFGKYDFVLCENLVSAIDSLLQQKPTLTNNFTTRLVAKISEQGPDFVKSLKLMKLLSNLLQNYSHQFKGHIDPLYKVVEQNTTFLKKKVLTLMLQLSKE